MKPISTALLAPDPHAFASLEGALSAYRTGAHDSIGLVGLDREDSGNTRFDGGSERKQTDAGRDEALWRWSSRKRRRSRTNPAIRNVNIPASRASDTLEIRPGTETL